MAETSDIKLLKRQRANVKAQVTRILSYLEEHADTSITALETRQSKLEQMFNSFSELQTAIEVRDEASDPSLEWESFEEQYYRAAEMINDRLKDLRGISGPVTTNRILVDSPSTVKQTSSLLRKIEIKPFDGNPIEWHSFHDTFKSLVHDNEELIGVQKFHLLKNALRGEASAVIESLNATEGNYLVAWDLLGKRCNKPRKIINAHLKLLFDLPEVTRDTPSSLRQLAEQAQVHVNALKAVNQPTEHWDTILIHIVSSKLDKNTRRSWERTLEDEEIPRFQLLLDFINKHARGDDLGIESSNPFKTQGIQDRTRSKTQARSQSYVATDERKQSCVVCKGEHPIYTCSKFLQLSIRDRLNTVRQTKLCLNCLRPNHTVIHCRLGNCRKCEKKHHTLLHFPTETQAVTNYKQSSLTPSTSSDTVKTALTVSYDSEILLGTAQVTILDKYNKEHACRVLLDSGSQTHFITHRLAELLQLEKHKIDLSFSGLGQLNTHAKYVVKTGIRSKTSGFRAQVTFIALPSITGRLPLRQIDLSNLELPRHIELADPEFHIPGEIDALIGNALFYELLETGQIKLSRSSVILQNTQVGWIVTGEVDNRRRNNSYKANRFCHIAMSLESQVSRFWAMEEIPEQKFLSAEERECETHFAENTTRDEQGRYIVKLPFNDKRSLLGDSKAMAFKRFYNLERKLQMNIELKNQYSDFLKEYSKLGHMTEVKDDNNLGYYLPHHAVVKESSTTTKVRVVFDASAKTSSGLSLNDTLLIGPTIQDTLFSILIRFRQHTFVIIADVEKMFRQIIVHPDDRDYQKILWRDSMNDAIKTFKLNTVTYGTAPAPFLATRSLKQLALDEAQNFPIASEIFLKDFYVDDLLTGADSFEAALEIKNQCIGLAKAGGFHLRQWASNDTRLIAELQSNTQRASLCLDPTEARKTLGIYWNTTDDKISYTFKQMPTEHSRMTKRVLLSQIAQLFDPLGLLGPVIIKAKIVMQQLWKSAIDWDDLVPQLIKQAWLEIKDELHLLNNFAVPRLIALHEAIALELHGFSDASEKAYGACLYIRSTNKLGQHAVHLLCAKSRVAPLKVVSLPRLELCAARLLVQLYKEIRKALYQVDFKQIRFWSDSTITLHWIKTSPHLLKTFVANRVSQIQAEVHSDIWFHVATADNPADFVSRGQLPAQLMQNNLWKFGPHWLSLNQSFWPVSNIETIEIPEKRRPVTLTTYLSLDLLRRYSSIDYLNRIVAYIFRFYYNIKCKNKKTSGSLVISEIQEAHLRIIRLVQLESFPTELNNLENGKSVNRKSRLSNLNPFIDDKGLIRVGSRLKHAQLRYNLKYPIVLPHKHHITELIIRQVHINQFHSGIQATLHTIRHKYWPLAGKSIVKQVIHNCIRCSRYNPKTPQYIMGDLPKNRVTQMRPFETVGVDYCGPFFIKEKKFRNQKKLKCYVVVFVCFATKATHLELATDLTTESCLGALKRFLARRGKPRHIYSDNGTNFIGAKNEIVQAQTFLLSNEYKDKFQQFLTQENIEWHFSPPRSPHFGGLWEAAVKAFKKHLHKTVGDAIFTYEQFYTLIVEIEAILNSRPLTPLSSDPNDFLALSPSHFLIGDSLACLPEHDLADIQTNKLSLWQHIQKIKQHFWKRWQTEYLQELHTRSKWHTGNSTGIKEGILVTIRDVNSPPLQWQLGRVVAVHPGEDNIVRVVTVRTPHGIYKRALKNLVPLPIEPA
ncbi:uncharacterized protein LOC114882514 [Osmia bicornis bicornis]|uniref:uncharacterized protein LOC114882514 n=1 Tax=Osmia bicornis bicornis TaxID=1437191 RepID=UPI001EAE8BC0|nr:uncharacterized protein LOC114882514 [Osmia bicornis bicornis]